MSNKQKNILLRAFTIDCGDLLTSPADVLKSLKNHINKTVVKDRMMPLSEVSDSSEMDVISDCKELDDANSIFCTMFRLIPKGKDFHISQNCFDRNTFNIRDIEKSAADSSASVRDFFWICLNQSHLVTANLSRSTSPKRIETYINWLLKTSTFSLTPEIKPSQDIRLGDLKYIKFSNPFGTNKNIRSSQNKSIFINTNLKNIVSNLFVDTSSLEDLDLESIVSAELKLKFKQNNDEETRKKLGTILKPIGDSDDVIFMDKHNMPKTGSDLKEEKIVPIETTEDGNISENQLNIEMARYLKSLTK